MAEEKEMLPVNLPVAPEERIAQILIVFAIWILQLILSPLWLKSFRFGPAEWVWRSLTYGRPQPMRTRN